LAVNDSNDIEKRFEKKKKAGEIGATGEISARKTKIPNIFLSEFSPSSSFSLKPKTKTRPLSVFLRASSTLHATHLPFLFHFYPNLPLIYFFPSPKHRRWHFLAFILGCGHFRGPSVRFLKVQEGGPSVRFIKEQQNLQSLCCG